MILDSGAVLALAARDAWARAFLAEAIADDVPVVIPAVVVAETVRGDGPRDAPVNRVLKAVGGVVPTTEPAARVAGRLLAAARMNTTVDALVVAEAIGGGGSAVILTGDSGDLTRLAAGHPDVTIRVV